MPGACEQFARKYREEILRGGLRSEFLMHLFTLWHFNLLKPDQLEGVISLIDKDSK